MIKLMNSLKIYFTYINKNTVLIPISILCGFIITFTVTMLTNAYSKDIQSDISREVIRFHVLANSDSNKDQALKLKVRDEVIKMLSADLKESNSKAETKIMLAKNIDKITLKAEEVIKAEGYDYPIKVEIGYSYFPTKAYGDIKLPAGEYEALRILIGNAEGKNWWCIMFPPLCFVDVTAKEVPQENKQQLEGLLTEDEFNLISKSEEPNIKVKFKVVEIFNSL